LKIRAMLISQGMNDAAATFAAAQVFHETNGLKSRVSKEDNNLSGIIWLNKKHQKNATRGLPRPRNEGGYYAHFATPLDWAKDFVRILRLGAYPPAEATELGNYVQRLKDNGYFTDSITNYYNGLKRWLLALAPAIPANSTMQVDKSGNITKQEAYNVDNPADRSGNLLNRLFDPRFEGERILSKKTQEGLLIGGLALVGVMVILNVTRR
jgi:hypothetical protein